MSAIPPKMSSLWALIGANVVTTVDGMALVANFLPDCVSSRAMTKVTTRPA